MTFNIINAGDPGLASVAMQNWRHINYGNVLLPVNSSGSGVDNTIDIGSSSFAFKDAYLTGFIQVGGAVTAYDLNLGADSAGIFAKSTVSDSTNYIRIRNSNNASLLDINADGSISMGISALNINSSGYLGVNTVSPAMTTEIYQDTNNSAVGIDVETDGLLIRNEDITAGSYSILKFGHASGAADTLDGTYIQSYYNTNNDVDLVFGNYVSNGTVNEIMRIQQDGKVGFGTDNPSVGKVDILGSDSSSIFAVRSASGGNGFTIEDSSGNKRFRLRNSSGTSTVDFISNGDCYFNTGGNLGVGTTSPDRRADILDASNPQLRLTHTDGSVYTDIQTDGSGNTIFTNTGTAITMSKAVTVSSLNSINSTELSQLANIDSSTISSTQWGYLGAMNQGVASGNSVTFNSINSINSTELSQLANIDSATISSTQWGYLGALNQGLTITSQPTFKSVTIENASGNNLRVSDTTETGDIFASSTKGLVFDTSYDRYTFQNDSTDPKFIMLENAGNNIAPRITITGSGGGNFALGEKSGTNGAVIDLFEIFHSSTGYAGTGATVFVTIRESSGNYEYRRVSFLLEQSSDGGDGGSVDDTLLSSIGSVTSGRFALSKTSTTLTKLQYTVGIAVTHTVTGYGVLVH